MTTDKVAILDYKQYITQSWAVQKLISKKSLAGLYDLDWLYESIDIIWRCFICIYIYMCVSICVFMCISYILYSRDNEHCHFLSLVYTKQKKGPVHTGCFLCHTQCIYRRNWFIIMSKILINIELDIKAHYWNEKQNCYPFTSENR